MKILLLAPARWLDDDCLNIFRTWLMAEGHSLEVAPQTQMRHNQLAGEDMARAAALNAALARTDIDVIWCARGGYGSARLLPLLHPRMAVSKQILVGYSDMTSLLLSDLGVSLIPIHGAMPGDLKSPQKLDNLQLALDLCRSVLAQSESESRIDLEALRPGSAHGPLVAANLNVLGHMLGTPQQPDLTGALLCLEDVGEYYYAIDRMFVHFKQAGVFDQITGLVLGSFSDLEDNEVSWGETVEQIALNHFSDGPVASAPFFGHATRNVPLLIGAHARLTCTDSGAELVFDHRV